MPRLPNRKGSATRRWTVGIVALTALLLAGFYFGLRLSNGPLDASRQGLGAALAEAGRDLRNAFAGSPAEPPADAAAPGSMQESLLNAGDGHRLQLFWRAITDAGFECADVKAVGAIGGTGSTWRANCGDASIYLIEVDEFGRLSVVPMPYGDIGPGGIVPNVEREFPE